MTCTPSDLDRRKIFWTTQPDACGIETRCGVNCGTPGLSLTETNCDFPCRPNTDNLDCPPEPTSPRSFATNDWVRSLVINMLMTDARMPDSPCGYRPGSQGGHWSESYIESGPTTIGTLMRTVQAVGSIQDGVNIVVAFAQSTLDRLIARGVASAVEVTGKYIGDGVMNLDILISGQGGQGPTKVGLSGQRVINGWVWQ